MNNSSKMNWIWFIGLMSVIVLTLSIMMGLKVEHKIISKVFFGYLVVFLFGVFFIWASRKKDNTLYNKDKKDFSESDARIIEHYTNNSELTLENYREAKLRQQIRFASVIAIPLLSSLILAIIFAFV